ncbi:Dipeptidase [Sporomusa rhizae]
MKAMGYVKRILFAVFLCLACGNMYVFACTAVYVGKDVSTDGSTIIARSEDQSVGAYNKLFLVVPRVENTPGRTLTDVNGFSMPLPATTYKYTMIPDNCDAGDGLYPASCSNECGVSVTGTVSAAPNDKVRQADPFVEQGLREASLTAAVAACVTTAREGVEKLTSLVETYGSAEGNIVMIADQQEAWLIEIYSGHQWAAQKMPTNKVAVFGNQFMLGTVDATDKENFLRSKDLFTLADQFGFAKRINGKVHLALTYGAPISDYSNTRSWGGHHLLAPSTDGGPYNHDTFYELFYTPDHKVSPLEVMDVLRYRYEGTNLDASLPQNKWTVRTVGVERQSEVHVLQIKEEYPRACSALQWLCMGNAEHSVFIPAFSGITETHPAYQVEGKPYDDKGAYWKFKRICALAEQSRFQYGQGVKSAWKQYEKNSYHDMLQAEKEMIALYAKDPTVGENYVTKLGMDSAQKALAEADTLYVDLLTYIMNTTGMVKPKLDKIGPFVYQDNNK